MLTGGLIMAKNKPLGHNRMRHLWLAVTLLSGVSSYSLPAEAISKYGTCEANVPGKSITFRAKSWVHYVKTPTDFRIYQWDVKIDYWGSTSPYTDQRVRLESVVRDETVFKKHYEGTVKSSPSSSWRGIKLNSHTHPHDNFLPVQMTATMLFRVPGGGDIDAGCRINFLAFPL